jgi:hypothetical protein
VAVRLKYPTLSLSLNMCSSMPVYCEISSCSHRTKFSLRKNLDTGELDLTRADASSVSSYPLTRHSLHRLFVVSTRWGDRDVMSSYHFSQEIGPQNLHHVCSDTEFPWILHFISFASYYLRSTTRERQEWMLARTGGPQHPTAPPHRTTPLHHQCLEPATKQFSFARLVNYLPSHIFSNSCLITKSA